jgi:hypothetical protein
MTGTENNGTKRDLENARVTFFLRSGASIKIGTAKDFDKRLAKLQEGLSRPLEVLAVVPAELAPEAELRERFAALAMRWRWFRADRALLDYIESVKAEAAALEPPKPPSPPMPATERAARDLTAKVPSLPEELHPFAYTAIEQLHNMADYVPGPWVSDERQTLQYQLKKTTARLGGM